MKKSTKIITTLMAVGASMSTIAPISACSCSNEVTISFSATTGGSIGTPTKLKVRSGSKWKEIKSQAPSHTADPGYLFTGWYMNGSELQDETIISKETQIIAHFELDIREYNLTLTGDAGVDVYKVRNIIGQDIIVGCDIKEFHEINTIEVKINESAAEYKFENNKIYISSSLIPTVQTPVSVTVTSKKISQEYNIDLVYATGMDDSEILQNEVGQDVKIEFIPNQEAYRTIDLTSPQSIITVNSIVYHGAYVDKDNPNILIIPWQDIDGTIKIWLDSTAKLGFHVYYADRFKTAELDDSKNKFVTFDFIPHGAYLEKGDVINAEITNQVHHKTPDETEEKRIKFYKDVDHVEVEKVEQQNIHFSFEAENTYSDTNLFEVEFSLRLSVLRDGAPIGESIVEHIFFENGVATTKDMFEYLDGSDSIIKGPDLTNEKWNDCEILVLPKETKIIDVKAFSIDSSTSKIPNIKWLILDETWGNILDPSGTQLTTIGKIAFQCCNHCRGELYIPSSVITIDESAFNKCTSFAKSKLVFGKKSKLKTIVDSAFMDCGLAGGDGKLELPQGIEVVQQQAFYNCDLKSVCIPNTLLDLNDGIFPSSFGGTFEKNRHLAEIDVSDFLVVPTTDQWKGDDAFKNTADIGIVYIHSSNQAEQWKTLLEGLGLDHDWSYQVKQ